MSRPDEPQAVDLTPLRLAADPVRRDALRQRIAAAAAGELARRADETPPPALIPAAWGGRILGGAAAAIAASLALLLAAGGPAPAADDPWTALAALPVVATAEQPGALVDWMAPGARLP